MTEPIRRTGGMRRRSARFGAMRRRRGGMTLMELVIVVGIVAVVASIALPALRPADRDALESVARVVAGDLRLARSHAIQFNTEWTVRFDFPGNAYELVHTGAGNPPPLVNPLAPAGAAGDYRVALDELVPRGGGSRVRLAGAVLKGSGAPVDQVTFSPLGGTGPVRSEDTLLLLIVGSQGTPQTLELEVSWVTGRVAAGRR